MTTDKDSNKNILFPSEQSSLIIPQDVFLNLSDSTSAINITADFTKHFIKSGEITLENPFLENQIQLVTSPKLDLFNNEIAHLRKQVRRFSS